MSTDCNSTSETGLPNFKQYRFATFPVVHVVFTLIADAWSTEAHKEAHWGLILYPEGPSDFKYTPGGVLQVTGSSKDDEFRKPHQLDVNGEKYLLIGKNGKSTSAMIGRLSSMESFVRKHGIKETSIQIAVYPFSNEDSAFSAPGDSRSIVPGWPKTLMDRGADEEGVP